MQGQSSPTKPTMTTIGNRPASVVTSLPSSDGVHVQCRLPSGEDAFVPLREIFRLFAAEQAASIRLQNGAVS